MCPELGVSSFGENPLKALEMLKEAVELYLENAKELNMLDVLTETLESPVKFQSTFEIEAV